MTVSPELALVPRPHIHKASAPGAPSVFRALAETASGPLGRKVIDCTYQRALKFDPALALLDELQYLCAVNEPNMPTVTREPIEDRRGTTSATGTQQTRNKIAPCRQKAGRKKGGPARNQTGTEFPSTFKYACGQRVTDREPEGHRRRNRPAADAQQGRRETRTHSAYAQRTDLQMAAKPEARELKT